MNKEELELALKEAGEKLDAKNEELKKSVGEQAQAVKADMEKLKSCMDEMQKCLDDMQTAMKKEKHSGVSWEVKSFAQELKEKLIAEAEGLKGMTSRKVHAVMVEVKSFLESATASITTGSLLPAPQIEQGVSKAPDRAPFLLDIITTGFTNALTVYWTQRKTRTDNSGRVTEGTLTTLAGGTVAQSVLGYETKSATMQDLLAFIKISNNSLEDIDWLVSEIQSELLTLMVLKLDAELLTGTVAVNGYDGILTVATAFNADGKKLKAGVVANNYDALKFAATQIKKAQFKPNYVILHPDDILAMELERDAENRYLWPPYMAVQPQFAGIQIIENTGITSGTYLIGDFKKAKFWIRKGFDLKIHDQNENDAITQLKTITLYSRGTLVVKDADKLAFVTDTFADSIAEISGDPIA